MPEYHNPQHDSRGSGSGFDGQRLIIIVVVAFILMIISQQFLFKPQKSTEPSTQQNSQQQSVQQQSISNPSAIQLPPPPVVTGRQGTTEAVTVVENDLYKITFSNRGALVKSWILKQYKDEKGNQLELVHEGAAQQYGYPLSFWTWDQGLRSKLNSVLYVAGATGKVSVPQTLTFEYADGDITVKKSFSFDNTYVVKVDTSVARRGSYLTALPAWPAGFGDATTGPSYASQNLDYQTASNLERKAAKKVSGGEVLSSPIQWGGAVDQYFAAIFLPEKPQQNFLVALHEQIDVPKDVEKPQGDKVKEPVLGAAIGQMNAPVSTRLFVGPKAIDVLESIRANGTNGEPNAGADLKGAVDFGMFAFIGRPLFAWAKWIEQNWFRNWGWAIVFMTVVINLVLLPLRLSSMKSALKMQRVAPQIKAIQEKYKKYKMNDPRRAEQNTEISALYKEHNVNPAGGCLPMVIQLPFLFAFYAMLGSAIELRHAKWLWLHDLSSPDKTFIIPILIIVSMLVMQRLTPTSGMSAEQQKMMNWMMPIMVGAMSYSVASGLGLYWVTGTIVGIVQQWVMNRTELGREMRTMALKRASKK